MKHTRKRIVITSSLLILLLGAGALSKPGRTTFNNFFLLLGRGQEGVKQGGNSLDATQGPDKEQRARAKHGWNNDLNNVVLRGTITYYRGDHVVRQAKLTVYQKYPDRIRVDEEHQGLIRSWGVDHTDAWRSRGQAVSEEQARDIRGWLRIWPERLFLMRGSGAAYREVGHRMEDSQPIQPGREPRDLTQIKMLDQVEIEDNIGGNRSDRRLVNYLIDPKNSTVVSARWLEPDDPRQRVNDPAAAKIDVRVDFDNWRRVNGVLWPTEITHRVGGKVDYRIEVSEVLLNQSLPNRLFESSGQ